jgi:hypothetical protein
MTAGDTFETAMTEYALACRARGDEAAAEQVFEALRARREHLRSEQRLAEAEPRLAEAGEERARHEAELARLEAKREALAQEARIADAFNRAALEARGNPLFAWGTVLVLDEDEPLPDWVRRYLRDAASALFKLAADQAVDARTATESVGRALGLSRPGFNAFEDVRKLEEVGTALETVANEPGMRDSEVAQIARDRRIHSSTVFRWLRQSKELEERFLRHLAFREAPK